MVFIRIKDIRSKELQDLPLKDGGGGGIEKIDIKSNKDEGKK